MHDRLDDSNFLLFAAKYYNNPQCYDTIEFYDDLKRFKYLRRLFNIYCESGDLRERLILNHIIILYNMFGPYATTKMLFFKLYDFQPQLKPFLELLNYIPLVVYNIGVQGVTINTSNIINDTTVQDRLRNI